jgi:LmbE family N-acetylglucosaminyl deacetylase
MEKIIVLSLFVLVCSCHKKVNYNQLKSVKSVMAVFAHADDETTVSPVLAKFVREGVAVHLIIATDGRHGVRPHMGVPAGDQLAAIRTAEVRCAAEKIGVSSLVFLDFEDGMLSNGLNLNLLGEKVDSLYQLIKPDLMISWGSGIRHRLLP